MYKSAIAAVMIEDGIRMCQLKDPFSNAIGIREIAK